MHLSLPLETPICFQCRTEALLCKCDLIPSKELVVLTAKPVPSSREGGIYRWVSLMNKHPNARKCESAAFAVKILGMGYLAALAKMIPELIFSPVSFLPWPDQQAYCPQEEQTLVKMVKDYANWAFYSLSSAEDANWKFSSAETAEKERLHHRQHLAPEAVQLFIQCKWTSMTLAHACLMFNAIQSYKPDTRLRYTLQQMWDTIAMIR